MAEANRAEFVSRLRRIDRTHRRLAHGYVQLVERDGVLVPMPRRQIARPGISYRGLMLLLGGALAVKGVLFAALGEGAYSQKVASLASGTGFEQVAAWVMQADPITRWIAAQMAVLF